MPVHQFVVDKSLADRGLTNYWGYNSIGFFAPHAPYASHGVLGQQVAEFKALVKTRHREGIEVILDVVYNHTVKDLAWFRPDGKEMTEEDWQNPYF